MERNMPNSPASDEIAISLKNVSKYYRLYHSPKERLKEALHPKGKQYHEKFYATKNLNLEIKKGEVLGIVGKNGSGKSTLLKLITGVLKPDEGSIEVNGQISALLELGSGFNPEFTGMQNIFFYGTILGFTREEMQERLDDILAFADIGEFIHQPLKTYSSGMKSRLGFAVAVHIDPEILILDEVLAVGDVLFRRKCYAKMEEFFKGGKTILYVSHDTHSVKQLCTRAIFLESGNILLDSDAKTVTTYYEKYLFSPAEKQQEIKQALMEQTNMPEDASRDIEETPQSDAVSRNDYLEDLIPASTVEYKNFDATISNIQIKDHTGRQVNVLQQDETYYYCYDVHFEMDAENVSFGMQIKDEKGITLTATSFSSFEQEIPHVNTGTRYHIEWSFTCTLLPGIYYTNAGTSALFAGERQFLHRIVDAACFKVVSKHPERYSGLVHLHQKIHYEVTNAKS